MTAKEWWALFIISLVVYLFVGIYFIETGHVYCTPEMEACGFYVGAVMWFTFTGLLGGIGLFIYRMEIVK